MFDIKHEPRSSSLSSAPCEGRFGKPIRIGPVSRAPWRSDRAVSTRCFLEPGGNSRKGSSPRRNQPLVNQCRVCIEADSGMPECHVIAIGASLDRRLFTRGRLKPRIWQRAPAGSARRFPGLAFGGCRYRWTAVRTRNGRGQIDLTVVCDRRRCKPLANCRTKATLPCPGGGERLSARGPRDSSAPWENPKDRARVHVTRHSLGVQPRRNDLPRVSRETTCRKTVPRLWMQGEALRRQLGKVGSPKQSSLATHVKGIASSTRKAGLKLYFTRS